MIMNDQINNVPKPRSTSETDSETEANNPKKTQPKISGIRARLVRLPLIGHLLKPAPVVTVVRLVGVIGEVGGMRRGITLASVSNLLETAFTVNGVVAVALLINSPGGSPVQSSLIQNRIRALREEHGIPVFSFAEDVAASGGYWLACAGDEIFADENSIIGSIGVISSGFGFDQSIKKLGIERRVYTSGLHKSQLDPFQPEKEEDVAHLRQIQTDIYDSFKAMIRDRRSDKLVGSEEEMFSGSFWTGRRAWEMGLVDGLGTMRQILYERFGKKIRFELIEQIQRFPWSRPAPGITREGGERGMELAQKVPQALLAVLEERAWWSRYGL